MKNAQPCTSCGNDQIPEFDPAAQLESLAQARGVKVSAAIRYIGINSAAYRRWRNRKPETAEIFNKIRTAIIDLAEQRDADQ